MTDIVIASGNTHKIDEIQRVLGTNCRLISMREAGFKDAISEYGDSFRMNSLIKAMAVHRQLKSAVIADDSGLVIPALNGEPGVLSARYAGPDSTDATNRQKLHRMIADAELGEPSAYFMCVISYVNQDQKFQVAGKVHGRIQREDRGTHGFGYDPLFIADGYSQTMAELGPLEKDRISHRGQALERLAAALKARKLI